MIIGICLISTSGIVTASFKIKAIVPLNEAHKIYFTQYFSGTSSATYSKELTGIPQDSYKEYTFSFKVGAYSSLKDIIFNVAKAFCNDVENGVFPSIKESFVLDNEEIEKLENYR